MFLINNPKEKDAEHNAKKQKLDHSLVQHKLMPEEESKELLAYPLE